MNLLEMTKHAESKFETYRNPDLSDWIAAIDPILEAVGECTIGRDTIDSIYLSKTGLNISTSYSVRCCAMNNRMFVPMEYLTVEDPIKLAKLRKLQSAIASAESGLEAAKNSVIRYEAALENSRLQYQQFLESN